jgi:hypothetical protein
MLLAGYVLSLPLSPDDGGSMFMRNVGLPPNYALSMNKHGRYTYLRGRTVRVQCEQDLKFFMHDNNCLTILLLPPHKLFSSSENKTT